MYDSVESPNRILKNRCDAEYLQEPLEVIDIDLGFEEGRNFRKVE